MISKYFYVMLQIHVNMKESLISSHNITDHALHNCEVSFTRQTCRYTKFLKLASASTLAHICHCIVAATTPGAAKIKGAF